MVVKQSLRPVIIYIFLSTYFLSLRENFNVFTISLYSYSTLFFWIEHFSLQGLFQTCLPCSSLPDDQDWYSFKKCLPMQKSIVVCFNGDGISRLNFEGNYKVKYNATFQML